MIEVQFGEYADIRNPGTDGEKWRYPVTWRLTSPDSELMVERHLKLEVLIGGSLLNPVETDYSDEDLERRIFAMAKEIAEPWLRDPNPGGKRDVKLESDRQDSLRSIDPNEVLPIGERSYKFDVKCPQTMPDQDPAFTITRVERGYQDPPDAIELGAKPGRPVKVARIIHAHCNRCEADMRLTKSRKSPEPGRFSRVSEFVHIVCPHCDVEATVPWGDVEGLGEWIDLAKESVSLE